MPRRAASWMPGSSPGMTAVYVAAICMAEAPWLIPVQSCQDRLAHHPILVLLGQEAQLLGELLDALAVGGLRHRVGELGAPVAAARAVGVEAALQRLRHVAPRIVLE